MQYKACKNGEIKVVQLLLECCNYEESGLNTRDKHGWTPFMYAFLLACLNGHKDIVKILFDHSDSKRIDINAKCKDGLTGFTG